MNRRALLAMAAVAIGGAAGLTSARGPARARPGDQRIALGDLTLLVQAQPWQLTLLGPGGEVVWQEAADLPLGYATTTGHTYRARRLVSAEPIGEATTQLIAETDDPLGGALALQVRSLGPRAVNLVVIASTSNQVAAVGGGCVARPDEHMVGFGERFDSVDQRGHVVDVWAEDRRVANYGPSTYAPLPVMFSSRGYGFHLERFEPSQFDLGATRPDRWTWRQDAAVASVVLTYGPSLKDLVQRNAEVSGLPPLPPMWLFGVWKTSVGGQDRVIGEMRRLRELKVPVSAVFTYDAVDSEANIGWPAVTFAGRSAGPYPHPAEFTRTLHELGFKVLNYFTADFHTDRPNFVEPATHGFLIHRPDGRVYVHDAFQVAWLDLSDQDAVDWWGASWRRAIGELGYDGGMLDLGELIPPDAVLADGSNGQQSHNRYPLLYASAAWRCAISARRDGDFALLLRSAARGSQCFQSAQWNGDAVMRWGGTDGLRSMVPAALSFGLSGFPFWHTELAGYVQADLSPHEERELWLRWLQLATWTSMLRDHLGDHPRTPIDLWLDDSTLEAFRRAAATHSSLVPYLYSLAAEASRTGMPLLRFMALEFPEDPRAWEQDLEYMLGPTFLVAPVVEPGATSRAVYLPPGEWVDWWRGTLHAGGQTVSVPAPLESSGPPVFARAGALIPLAAEHDSLVPATSTSSSIRTYGGDLIVRLVPSSQPETSSTFVLYDGTRLRWTGRVLEVRGNALPRQIEFRLPDGRLVAQPVPVGDARLVPPA